MMAKIKMQNLVVEDKICVGAKTGVFQYHHSAKIKTANTA